MSMSSDPAVSNLPLSDPNCIKAEDACIAYYAAANASQDAISWSYQFQYGHWATYYYVISNTPTSQLSLQTGATLVINQHLKAF